MCGLTGFWAPDISSAESAARCEQMAAQLRHRGPDDSGTCCDSDSGYAVSHRRLSIVDLSACGHQPMLSASERWVLAYNGEIYNHLELRQRLEDMGVTDFNAAIMGVEEGAYDRTLEFLSSLKG